jgi:general secretion pathway protein G
MKIADLRLTERGYTMIEVLIVVTMIVILASMSMAIYRNSVTAAKEAVLKKDLFEFHEAIDKYYVDRNKYPADLMALVTDGYIREVPIDPFTNSRDTWQTMPADPDPNNPAASIGIFKVASGSDGIALDGTRYADWK